MTPGLALLSQHRRVQFMETAGDRQNACRTFAGEITATPGAQYRLQERWMRRYNDVGWSLGSEIVPKGFIVDLHQSHSRIAMNVRRWTWPPRTGKNAPRQQNRYTQLRCSPELKFRRFKERRTLDQRIFPKA